MFFLLLAALALGACQASPATAPAASRTPTPPGHTPTPDATADAIHRANARGTQTQAAWTATFQAFTQAAVVSQTGAAQTATADWATREASFWATQTAVLPALQTAAPPVVAQSLPSPDGKWTAEILQYPCTQLRANEGGYPDAYEILRVGGGEIASQHYWCGGQGAYGFEAKFWTPDSRFFYYTDAREGWPDGGYPWRRPISRYDTVTGQSETLGLAVFSPDGQKIAGAQGPALVVWDVNGGAVQRFTGMGGGAGSFGVIWAAWAGDGERVAYVSQRYCTNTYPCPTTLRIADLSSGQQSAVLGEQDTPVLTVEWLRPDWLELWGADFQTHWLYDLGKGTMERIFPTLTPGP